MAITKEVAQSHLQTWLDAEEKIALGQSVDVNGRKFEFADLADVREQILFWDRRLRQLDSASASRIQRVILTS